MRHYSSLSEDEIHSLSLVYPTTANVMLCSQYDISRAGLHRLAVSHGWEKKSCYNGNDKGARRQNYGQSSEMAVRQLRHHAKF